MRVSEKDILAELVVYLNDIDVFDGKCDCQTLKHSRIYMKERGLSDSDIEEMCSFMEGFGGYCDCEVLMNVVPTVFPTEEEFHEYVDKAVRKIHPE
jgi:hypothetical protein